MKTNCPYKNFIIPIKEKKIYVIRYRIDPGKEELMSQKHCTIAGGQSIVVLNLYAVDSWYESKDKGLVANGMRLGNRPLSKAIDLARGTGKNVGVVSNAGVYGMAEA